MIGTGLDVAETTKSGATSRRHIQKGPMTTTSVSGALPRQAAMSVLVALAVTHLLNDTIQSLIPAIYPIIKAAYQLDYGQIGLITLAFQISASLLQPAVGRPA